MAWKVIKYFTDLEDHRHAYSTGDIYPRPGLHPTDRRIRQLAGTGNRLKSPVIEWVEEKPAEHDPPKKKPEKKPARRTPGK